MIYAVAAQLQKLTCFTFLDPPEWRPSTTGKEKDTTATDGDHFDEGDLARIFDQDFTEEEPR